MISACILYNRHSQIWHNIEKSEGVLCCALVKSQNQIENHSTHIQTSIQTSFPLGCLSSQVRCNRIEMLNWFPPSHLPFIGYFGVSLCWDTCQRFWKNEKQTLVKSLSLSEMTDRKIEKRRETHPKRQKKYNVKIYWSYTWEKNSHMSQQNIWSRSIIVKCKRSLEISGAQYEGI